MVIHVTVSLGKGFDLPGSVDSRLSQYRDLSSRQKVAFLVPLTLKKFLLEIEVSIPSADGRVSSKVAVKK